MWTPPPRSAEARAAYEAAEAGRAAHPERYRLDPETLAASAFAKVPLAADDNGDWKEGFERYVEAARDEGRLNALGQRSMAGTATGRLQARTAIARAAAQNPDIAARHIDRPIFIIGGWRTGTTLLQRLLATVPALRGAYPAELAAPWLFVNRDQAARDAIIDAGEAAHGRLHLLNPAMQSIHPSGGRLPEECVLAMGTDFRNWGFTSTLRCPSYSKWLFGQETTSAYGRYGQILRMLDDGSGRRWILKAPAHTAELPSLHRAFPTAHIVHLHRDVVETVTSGASLFAVFRSTYSDDVDPAEVGRYQLDVTALWFDRAMRARPGLPPGSVLDIAYSELVTDPIEAARKICRAFDVDWDEATQISVQAGLARLRGQRGTHRYLPQDFGLDPDEILERFSGYRGAFGLP